MISYREIRVDEKPKLKELIDTVLENLRNIYLLKI